MPQTLRQRCLHVVLMLVPLLLAALHALGFIPTNVLHRLDNTAYDVRLRAAMPGTLEPRVVIVDIDPQSLAAIGPWPWPRAQLARLVDTLFEQQQIAVLGFDIVFPKPDPQSGGDAALAAALRERPVVLGYFFSNESTAHNAGVLPAPVMGGEVLHGRPVRITQWDTFESNLLELALAAPSAGAFNALPDIDGVVRSVPLLVEHQGQAYESLALAVFRRVLGSPPMEPGFATGLMMSRRFSGLESLRLQHKGKALAIPVDERVSALVPYRGRGGPEGGSFTYVSAIDLLSGRVPPGQLQGRIALMGTTAASLKDLRLTPVGANYPGVEVHANLITGLLDGQLPVKPDYALGYEMLVLMASSLVLVWWLPGLGAWSGAALSGTLIAAVFGLNSWLQIRHGLVLPLAGSVLMILFTAAIGLASRRWMVGGAQRDPCGSPTLNLAGLCAVYGVDRIATEEDRQREPGFVWQEIDRLRPSPGASPVPIYTPLSTSGEMTADLRHELRQWQQALRAWRAQDWDACDVHLLNLQRQNAKKVLYRLYADRVASQRHLPPDPGWDGATAIKHMQSPKPRTGTPGHTRSKFP